MSFLLETNKYDRNNDPSFLFYLVFSASYNRFGIHPLHALLSSFVLVLPDTNILLDVSFHNIDNSLAFPRNHMSFREAAGDRPAIRNPSILIFPPPSPATRHGIYTPSGVCCEFSALLTCLSPRNSVRTCVLVPPPASCGEERRMCAFPLRLSRLLRQKLTYNSGWYARQFSAG